MPKLIKEKQWLLNSAIIFNNYPIRKTRKTRNSLAAGKVAKERNINIPIIIQKDFIKTEEFRHKTVQKKAEIEGWFDKQIEIWNENESEKHEKEIVTKYETITTKDKNWTYIKMINKQIEENRMKII
jgi:hypothetical protein